MSTTTIATYNNRVLAELQEASTSTIAALVSGAGTNGVTVTPADGMLAVLNEAKDELVKKALPVSFVATLAVTSGAGPVFPLASFTAAGVKAMRVAETVSFAGRVLTKTSPEQFAAYYPQRTTGASATPKYWSNAKGDQRAIELQAKPNAAGTLTVAGYGIPADAIDAATGTFAFIAADDEPALVLYAAVKLCRRSPDDARLAAVLANLAPRLDATMLAIRGRIQPAAQSIYLDDYVPHAGVTP